MTQPCPNPCRRWPSDISCSPEGEVMAAGVAAQGACVFGAPCGVGRVQLGLAVGACALALAGCGASTVPIPRASPSPRAQATVIAPGVTVPKTQLATPSFTVSTSHPLPTGVSAEQVVQDVQIDNLIENIAIERQDAALLAYADTGDWLAAIADEISTNAHNHTKILSINDVLNSVEVGFQPDPQDASATASVILKGSEVQVEINQNGKRTEHTQQFDVLRWLVWSQPVGRYLTCDTGSA